MVGDNKNESTNSCRKEKSIQIPETVTLKSLIKSWNSLAFAINKIKYKRPEEKRTINEIFKIFCKDIGVSENSTSEEVVKALEDFEKTRKVCIDDEDNKEIFILEGKGPIDFFSCFFQIYLERYGESNGPMQEQRINNTTPGENKEIEKTLVKQTKPPALIESDINPSASNPAHSSAPTTPTQSLVTLNSPAPSFSILDSRLTALNLQGTPPKKEVKTIFETTISETPSAAPPPEETTKISEEQHKPKEKSELLVAAYNHLDRLEKVFTKIDIKNLPNEFFKTSRQLFILFFENNSKKMSEKILENSSETILKNSLKKTLPKIFTKKVLDENHDLSSLAKKLEGENEVTYLKTLTTAFLNEIFSQMKDKLEYEENIAERFVSDLFEPLNKLIASYELAKKDKAIKTLQSFMGRNSPSHSVEDSPTVASNLSIQKFTEQKDDSTPERKTSLANLSDQQKTNKAINDSINELTQEICQKRGIALESNADVQEIRTTLENTCSAELDISKVPTAENLHNSFSTLISAISNGKGLVKISSAFDGLCALLTTPRIPESAAAEIERLISQGAELGHSDLRTRLYVHRHIASKNPTMLDYLKDFKISTAQNLHNEFLNIISAINDKKSQQEIRISFNKFCTLVGINTPNTPANAAAEIRGLIAQEQPSSEKRRTKFEYLSLETNKYTLNKKDEPKTMADFLETILSAVLKDKKPLLPSFSSLSRIKTTPPTTTSSSATSTPSSIPETKITESTNKNNLSKAINVLAEKIYLDENTELMQQCETMLTKKFGGGENKAETSSESEKVKLIQAAKDAALQKIRLGENQEGLLQIGGIRQMIAEKFSKHGIVEKILSETLTLKISALIAKVYEYNESAKNVEAVEAVEASCRDLCLTLGIPQNSDPTRISTKFQTLLAEEPELEYCLALNKKIPTPFSKENKTVIAFLKHELPKALVVVKPSPTPSLTLTNRLAVTASSLFSSSHSSNSSKPLQPLVLANSNPVNIAPSPAPTTPKASPTFLNSRLKPTDNAESAAKADAPATMQMD